MMTTEAKARPVIVKAMLSFFFVANAQASNVHATVIAKNTGVATGRTVKKSVLV